MVLIIEAPKKKKIPWNKYYNSVFLWLWSVESESEFGVCKLAKVLELTSKFVTKLIISDTVLLTTLSHC